MKIRIEKVNAFGGRFANLTPGSEHKVITVSEHHGRPAYWVQGAGDLVLVLAEECTVINK